MIDQHPTLDELKARYHRIALLLKEMYGYPEWREHLSPVDELVSTILSQHTWHDNRDRALSGQDPRLKRWRGGRCTSLGCALVEPPAAARHTEIGPRTGSAP